MEIFVFSSMTHKVSAQIYSYIYNNRNIFTQIYLYIYHINIIYIYDLLLFQPFTCTVICIQKLHYDC